MSKAFSDVVKKRNCMKKLLYILVSDFSQDNCKAGWRGKKGEKKHDNFELIKTLQHLRRKTEKQTMKKT